jgi:hypothetical protein
MILVCACVVMVANRATAKRKSFFFMFFKWFLYKMRYKGNEKISIFADKQGKYFRGIIFLL